MAAFQNTKILRPKAPDRGSFPLDHYNTCKRQMMEYMQCLVTHNRDSKLCRTEAKEYLTCRMDNDLMAPEEWSYLGFSETNETKGDEKN